MKRARKIILIALGTLIGCVVLVGSALMLFFNYMAEGELYSHPSGSRITVAFSSSDDVNQVMRDICQSGPSDERLPTVTKDLYEKLLAGGILAQVPYRTPVNVHENGGFRGTTLAGLTRFRFENGPWKGKDGWTCPHSVTLFHPYP